MEIEEHVVSLSMEDIQAISLVRHDVDMYKSAISSEMIQLCINTLNSDHITKKEQVLGCFTIPVKWVFLGIAADLGLTVYGGDATDAYAHFPAPRDTYLAIDDAYGDWYKDKFGKEVNRRHVLPVYHCL